MDPIVQAFSIDCHRFMLAHHNGKFHPLEKYPLSSLTRIDPAHPKEIRGAIDTHVVIPPSLQARTEPCDLETGRNWFMRGWIESGADPAKCEAMFRKLEPEGKR